MEFKNNIKQLRIEKNLTHTQLASQLEKSEAAVRAWETGRNKPDADTLIKLAGYFDCTTDYLLGISNIKNERKEQEVDELINSLKDTISSLDRFYLATFKRFIRNIIKIKDWKFIPNNVGLSIICSLDEMTRYIIDIMENMCVARDISRRDSLNQDDCYSIMLDIKNAYKMELRTQNVIAGTFEMLVSCPAARIKKVLENAGLDADFILEDADDKALSSYDFFDYLESDDHDAKE